VGSEASNEVTVYYSLFRTLLLFSGSFDVVSIFDLIFTCTSLAF